MVDLFSDLDPDSGSAGTSSVPTPMAAQVPNTEADPFSDLDPDNGPGQTSALGAGARSAERSIIPAAGGLVAAGAAAPVGAAAGAAIGGAIGGVGGAFFGGIGAVPGAVGGAELGGDIGALLAGVGGGIGGTYAADQAQTYAAKAVPDSWKDVLGGTDRQQQLDQTYQPTASFLGGMVPYVLTMHPFGGVDALPENATALQRINNNPVLSRVFSGGVMGGMQLVQEAASGQPVDWNNVAIATGAGMIFNKPNAIGQKLESIGAAGAGRVMGRVPATPEEAAAAPTIAQAGDAKVVGPGITEDVFMGNHRQAPAAEQAAQDAARTESSILGTTPAPVPDVSAIAHKQEPELFGKWDALTQQQDDLRAHLASLASPADEDIDAVSQQRDALQQQLDEHIASRGGYEGGAQARALRAQVRDQQAQMDEMAARRDAFAAGQGADTPEMSSIRQQIQATDLQLRDLAPQVSAAHRRAADYAGTETVEPTTAAPSQPVEAAPNDANSNQITSNEPAQPSPAGPVSAGVQQQAAAIASSIARQFEAAGRPADEAEALGRTEAARIVQRSQRMNGALGEPLNLYNSEGANIVRGGERAPLAATASTEAAPVEPPAAPQGIAPDAVADAVATAKNTGQQKLIDKMLGIGASNKEIADMIGRKLSENQIAAYRSGAQSKPPLMPTVDEPAIGNPPEVVAQRQQQQAEPSVVNQETAPRPAGGIEALDPSTIGVDANRFQFKAGGDESGVTERLQGVEKWDPRLAGTALVYRDENGKNWIADGHQRLALAQRLAAGQPDIRLNSFVLDAADGVTDADARAIAAVKNIAEGTGTAIDAAKVIREAKETGITLPPLPPRSTLVRDGNALSSLSPDAFGMVVNEVISPADGAMVGRLVKDPDQQSEAVRLLSQTKPENAQQAEMIVRDMLGSGTEMMTKQGGLFGDEAFASSVVLERAKIADQAVKLLRKDKATFGTLVKEAERIQGAGSNVLDQEANQSRLSTDEKASDLLTQLAFRAGPVSDALSGIARRLKSGDISPAEGAREFLGSVRSAVEGGVDTGADVGGAVAGAAGEREGLATEPGAEGLPQTLIPGVEPITDAQRAQLEADRGLHGGDAAPGGLFDEDAQNQRTLFQSKDDHGDADRNLFVVHNIKPDGLLNAAKIGGLPMPSLAIARTDRGGFEGFGEISLIGDRNMVDPAQDRAARVHNTDAYSPRYPGVTREIDDKAFNALNKPIVTDIKALGGSASDGIDLSGLEDRGLREARGRTGMEYAFIKEKGLPFEPVTKDDGVPDWGANRSAITKLVDAHRAEFEDWADSKISPLIKRERIFKGFTDSGNRRYADHTLQNAYADMKSRMSEGEGFNYGVGSIRARWSKVYKSITGLEADRDKIVPQADIAKVKEAFDDRFMEMADEMRPYYRFDGKGMQYLDDTSQMMAEMATKGPRVLDEGFKDLPPELVQKVRELGADLASAPTAYFEAKLNRTVGLDEFRGALVPSGTRQSVLDALQKAGVKTYQYDSSDPNSRIEALKQVQADQAQANVLFQGKRGSVSFKENARPLLKVFQEANASTGIHELGHIWLEDMLKDAVHPAANDELRADAQTIRKNLGMTDDQSKPLTQQHEQFAKWTEQYLREGRAPSAELAGVFAKFKSWLTQIYQTVKNLGLPLSDDMRGVFDRLLTSEPNRTVIAPDAERPATLAATHETDAAQVHPAEAEPVGDRIVAERDAEIARQSPEVQNEIAEAIQRHAATIEPAGSATAEPGSEDVDGTGGQPEVGGSGGGPGAEPTGGGNSSERGAVNEGSGAGVQQSARVSAGSGESGLRQQRPGAADNAGASNPLQPEPAATIPRNGNGLTDLAGNIRVENLTSEADVAQAIKQSAAENNNFIGDRRGVITDGQVVDLADALGMDAAALNRRKLGEAWNAEQIVAARKLLIQSATDLGGIAQRAANGTDADVTAYAMAKARHNMIQSHVAGLTAEAGRALRAFRSLVGQEQAKAVGDFLQQSDARTLFQLKAEAKMMAELDTPEKVSKFARDAEKPDFWDHVLEYWTNGLISNPATHATYAAGTEMMSLMRAGPETAAAAAIGRLRQLMGRQGERVHLAEVGAAMRAHLESAPAGAKAMADSLVTGTSTLLPGEKPYSTPFQPKGEFAPHGTLQEGYTGTQLLSDLYGTTRGILDGTLASGVLARAAERAQEEPGFGLEHSPLGTIPNVRMANGVVIPTGDLARLPSRGVSAIHSFFKATNYSMNMARSAVRQASEEGLEGQAYDARVAELRQSPTPAMFDAYDKAQRSGGTISPEIEASVTRARAAAAAAMDTTLMGPGSEFTRALSNLTNKRILGLPILKLIDPFVRIGGNVINQAIVERTPLGILAPEIRADLSGKNGNVAQDTAMGRMLVGTALSIGFGALAARNVISGSGPSDPGRAAMWRLAGNQPYSVRIGDTWYSLSHLGPLGMILGVSADMYDVAHLASEGDMLAAGSSLQHAITQNILDESFMRGPSDLIEAVDNPGRHGQAYIRSFVSSFMPYSSLSAQLARMGDPYSRQARSVMDGIKQKVPGMSETLSPYINIYGEPEQNFGALGGMTSIYQSPVSKDPVSIGLYNLGIAIAQPERSIRGVRLTDEQYAKYQQLAGRMLHSRLTTIMTSPDFSTWTPEAQYQVVQAVKDQSRETARNALMGQFPAIANQAYTAKLAKLRGTPQ